MDQSKIRKKRKEYEKKLKDLENEREMVQLKWRRLQQECEHPDKYSTSLGGEDTVVCPDCSFMI
jgi:hypothetical protein